MNYCLAILCATLATSLPSLSGSAAVMTTKNIDITVTHSESPCSCGAGGSPNICPSNATPTAGSTINVTLACGSAGNYIAFNAYDNGENIGGLNPIATGGVASGAFSMTVPAVSSDRPQAYVLQLNTGPTSGFVANGQTVTAPATFTQVLGASLPASAGGDPFVPAHTMTVCSSGCGFQHPQDAIDSATSSAWDNVLITVQVADYPFDNLSVIGNPANHFNVDSANGAPAHLWIKGIIGSSGTDGTQFPTFHGTSSTGGSILRTSGTVQVTFDNIEFGGFNYWNSVLNGSKTTLRNVYIWNSLQGIISGDGLHHDLYIYNSHFARNGGGNGPEHNIYAGEGDSADVLVVQNSILEQVNVGHDIKTRASSTTLTCDQLLINQDNVYLGSELLDCSEGRVCTVRGVQFLNGGANPSWSNNQSYDALRFGADREFTTLTNNYIDLQNSLLISDNNGYFRFINLFQVMSPSPPYSATNNTFVFSNSGNMLFGNNPFVPNRDGVFNGTSSAIVWGNSDHDSSSSANVNLGTVGTTNFVYSDRASASLPSLGTYPKSYNDAAFSGITPATCTDTIGLVKVPAS